MSINPILHNPFRIIGVWIDASEAELLRQKTRQQRFLSIGKSERSDADLILLGPLDRTEQSVADAFSKLEQPEDRLGHSLFWFIAGSEADKIAIKRLDEGDFSAAKMIWERERSSPT